LSDEPLGFVGRVRRLLRSTPPGRAAVRQIVDASVEIVDLMFMEVKRHQLAHRRLQACGRSRPFPRAEGVDGAVARTLQPTTVDQVLTVEAAD
jgi:hypothetical protein